MTDTVILTEIARAIPVLVGGILAVAGGVGSQFLVHRLADRRERRKLRRERIEALVKAVYAHGQWIEEKQTKWFFEMKIMIR
jgi:ABC-type nitrate/sulfonate/bicarbonate transport system substrate-binding protein